MQADAVHLGIRVLRSRCRGAVTLLHLSLRVDGAKRQDRHQNLQIVSKL
jgi:hypothetical protein